MTKKQKSALHKLLEIDTYSDVRKLGFTPYEFEDARLNATELLSGFTVRTVCEKVANYYAGLGFSVVNNSNVYYTVW